MVLQEIYSLLFMGPKPHKSGREATLYIVCVCDGVFACKYVRQKEREKNIVNVSKRVILCKCMGEKESTSLRELASICVSV